MTGLSKSCSSRVSLGYQTSPGRRLKNARRASSSAMARPRLRFTLSLLVRLQGLNFFAVRMLPGWQANRKASAISSGVIPLQCAEPADHIWRERR